MDKELENILREGIKQINPQCSHDELFEKLRVFYTQINLFNPVYKLVAASEEEIITRHILDSLAPVNILSKFSDDTVSFADLGSGSGLPGIVLSLAMKDKKFDLVDRMGRRAGFLRNTVALFGLKDRVNVVEKDVEKLDCVYDNITFRAFRPLKDIISQIDRITHKGSYVFAYKSSEENIDRESSIAREYGCFDVDCIAYNVPFSDSRRSILMLKKTF